MIIIVYTSDSSSGSEINRQYIIYSTRTISLWKGAGDEQGAHKSDKRVVGQGSGLGKTLTKCGYDSQLAARRSLLRCKTMLGYCFTILYNSPSCPSTNTYLCRAGPYARPVHQKGTSERRCRKNNKIKPDERFFPPQPPSPLPIISQRSRLDDYPTHYTTRTEGERLSILNRDTFGFVACEEKCYYRMGARPINIL